jgi:hypothetical protein
MLEERSGGIGVLTSIEDGCEGRHTAWLAEAVKHARRTSRVLIAKVGSSRRVGALDGWLSSLKQLRLEEGQRVFEGIRLGTGQVATDGVGV